MPQVGLLGSRDDGCGQSLQAKQPDPASAGGADVTVAAAHSWPSLEAQVKFLDCKCVCCKQSLQALHLRLSTATCAAGTRAAA